MNYSPTRSTVLLSGVLSLILTLGIARFSYTPLLPVMQLQTGLSDALGGWLATSNYLGYMLGAFITSLIGNLVIKDRLYRAGLVIAVITTFAMAITDDVWIWAIMRFLAGLSSAAGLLIGSGLLLNWLIKNGHRSELGIHFSGLGLGIAVVSIIVQQANNYLTWQDQWMLLGIVALLLAIPAWRWLPCPTKPSVDSKQQETSDQPPSKTFLHLMQLAYFCAGVGYVVSATFIVAIVEKQPLLEGQGEWAFLAVGLAAAPACIIWDFIARRTGVLNALLYAYVLQIISILLPIYSANLFVTIFSAVLFGGTFIGIVSLVLTMAGRFYPSKPAILMGKLTLSYGLAQVIGPAISGQIAQSTGSYNGALYMAAGFMLAGTAAIFHLKNNHQKQMPAQ